MVRYTTTEMPSPRRVRLRIIKLGSSSGTPLAPEINLDPEVQRGGRCLVIFMPFLDLSYMLARS
jgi:hypothetical protein